MIKFKNVTKMYDNGFQAVRSTNFEIQKGELLVLIGPSGSGKSTTMKMINRIIPHSSGTITIDGKDIKSYNAPELRRNIGYVIQQIGLFPHYTIEKNIAIVPQLKGWDKKEIKTRVKELLEIVGLDPEAHASRYPRELSGGQQQRVGIARALASNPDIILMDEPFSALDPITREQLQAELITLHRKFKKTIVFVTHDIDEALKLGDRIAIMQNGSLVQLDTPEKLLHEPAHGFVEEFIGKHRIAQSPDLMPVTEIMAETVVTASPWHSLERTISLMRHRKVTSAIILDDDKKVVGIVSAYDLIRKLNTVKTVDEIMEPADPYLLNTATAEDAIVLVEDALVEDAPFKMIPVVDTEHKLVGIVTSGSLLSALSSQWTKTEEDQDE